MSRTALAVVCALLLGLPSALSAEAPGVLRVCADPDNLPFSSDRADGRGLYVELAELVAARLGVRAEYFWWRSYFGKRTVRSTLLADECDAYFGLPYDPAFMSQSVALTRPFLDMSYAVITPPALPLTAVDGLKGRRVAVSFGSYPQLFLADRGGFELVTFREPEEALDALVRGEADAAFVWGPIAGHYNKSKLASAYRVSPVAGPGLAWQAAVGVRKTRDDLRAAIEGALAQLGPDVARLAETYGFPSGPAIGIERAVGTSAPPDAAGGTRAGRSLFNQHCSHCHAPNAMSPEPSRDLRRLRARYGDKMRETAYATVKDGRSSKGMPAWKESLSDEAIGQIVAFLESVQN